MDQKNNGKNIFPSLINKIYNWNVNLFITCDTDIYQDKV